MLDCIDAIFTLEEHLLFSHRATKGTVNFVQCKCTQFIKENNKAKQRKNFSNSLSCSPYCTLWLLPS